MNPVNPWKEKVMNKRRVRINGKCFMRIAIATKNEVKYVLKF